MPANNHDEFKLTLKEVHAWTKSGSITKQVFAYLKQEIFQRVKVEWERKMPDPFPDRKRRGISEQLFGFGSKYSPDKWEGVTVAKVIADDPKVKSFINLLNPEKYNFGQFFYKNLLLKFNPAKDRDPEEAVRVVSCLYLHVYFVFLGFKGITDFDEKVIEGVVNLPDSDSFPAPKEKDVFNYYVGFYFSINDFRINNFILEISKKGNEEGKHIAKEWGLHNNRAEFNGLVWVLPEYLYACLKGADGTQFNIIGMTDKDPNKWQKQKIIKSSIQTVVPNVGLFSTESMLYKISQKEKEDLLLDKTRDVVKLGILTEYEFSILSLYLAIHRNTYRVSDPRANFGNLIAKRKIVRNYRYLHGTYRIWNFVFGERHKIAQSRFTINPDGTAFLEPFIKDSFTDEEFRGLRQNLRNQTAIINISDVDGQSSKIWVVTFTPPGLSIANVALLDYPGNKKDSRIIEGSFSSIGYNKSGIMSGYMVMVKDDSDFKVEEMTREEAVICAKHNNLMDMHISLYALWKKKLWKKNKKKMNSDKKQNMDNSP